ncbi:signal transduction histidine kinase [Kitasatospora sp. MAA4]|uniref:sensor histidine kinase n=1 Tax=Kitasatospora sp. MAA4 TaxID=3035093 RepID=UPI0024748742|nr:histidine kinase [Kitasatospora sp. MAA4]MDH6131876.1 signal transduction histidine kinase [Kitasatospora sp. MAA4]
MTTADLLPAALGRRFPRVVRGLAGLRVRLLTQRYPTTVDFGFALVVLVLTAATHGRHLHHHPGVWLLQVALVLPLTFRRRAPYAVFGVTAGVAFVQWLTSAGMPADIAVLLALYTVAAHCPRRRTLVAYGIAELGVVLAVTRWLPHNAYDSPLESWCKAAFMLSGATTAAAVLGLNVRARRAQLVALRERARELELQRDQQAALAVAEERSRIAREMHDIVTHNLSVMVALADGAAYANPHAPDRATAAMRQSAETGRQALTDMRRFLGVLRADEPDALRHPQPGLGQLEALTAQVRAAGLPTELRLDGEVGGISPGAQLTVYRLVQESLTNTLKHTAPGARAVVMVRCSADAVQVEVRDDGRAVPGGSSAGGPAHVGHGLAGMRDRAAAYGGELSAGPLPGGGWRVAVTLDLGPDPQEVPPS